MQACAKGYAFFLPTPKQQSLELTTAKFKPFTSSAWLLLVTLHVHLD
jgi:hypothetical protein